MLLFDTFVFGNIEDTHSYGICVGRLSFVFWFLNKFSLFLSHIFTIFVKTTSTKLWTFSLQISI